jgi:hypothetical protein
MIPLRPSLRLNSLQKKLLIAFLLAWLSAELSLHFVSLSRAEKLFRLVYHPDKPFLHFFKSLFFFQNTFLFLLNSLFAYVFLPQVLSRSWRTVILFGASLVAVFLTAKSFFWIHPYLGIPVTLADAWLGFFLGAVMRADVWGNVDTLVFGPGIFRVFRVPSYVLLFFWFFYLMVGNLFLVDPFSNLPMIYWLPFSSFILGFLAETIIRVVLKQGRPIS